MWRRLVEAPIKRVDLVEDSSIDGYRWRPRKIIGETIKRDKEFNGLNVNMIHDWTL